MPVFKKVKDTKKLYTPEEVINMENKIKKGLTEESVLYSSGYKKYFTRTARIVTGKDVSVMFNKTAPTAYTDGSTIVINPTLSMMEDLSFAEKTLVNLGFVAHEIFHILFTDFRILHKAVDNRAKWKYFSVLKDINNIIEDSAIELFGTNYYEGDFKIGILFLNETIFNKSSEIKQIPSKLNQIMCAMSQFGSVGKIKGNIPKGIQDYWEKTKPLLVEARHSKSCQRRWDLSEEIYNILTSLIVEEIEKYQEQSKTNNFDSKLDENLGGTGQEISPDVTSDFQDDIKKSKTKEENKDKQSSNSNTSTPYKGSIDEQIKNKISSLDSDMEEVAKDIVSEKSEDLLEKNKSKKVEALLQDIDFSSVHKETKNKIVFFNRNDIVYHTFIEQYSSIVEKNKDTINILQNRIKKILKYSHDDMLKGQTNGKFTTSQVTRIFIDGKVFQKEKEKSKPSVAFEILVDESGSMEYNNRIKYAQEACAVFYEVCSKLNIPLAIIGFTANFHCNEVVHNHVVDFDSPSICKYNIINLQALEDNRDGYSVRYAGEYLIKRTAENRKVLIVISDGEPCHSIDKYADVKGGSDLVHNIEKIEKKGVKIIALNIGGSTVNLSKFYKTCINIPNIESLPDRILTILKKYFK